MKTCVIFNPTARGEKARRFRRHLDEIGTQSVLKLTTGPGEARRLAAEAVNEGFGTVVAAGGDGTVNEVLNGMGDAPEGFAQARLAVLPLGTVNVFARELEIPLKIAAAWECIRRGRETQIDLPCAQSSHNGLRQSRYFAQLAGAGLDARAVELVAWELKKKLGVLAYVFAGLKALIGAPAEITLRAGGATAMGALVLVGNGRLYGGSFRIFPRADLRDGLLDACLFPRVNWLTLARCSPGLLLRGQLPGSAVKLFQAKEITLTAANRTPAEIDGELFGALPASFSLAPYRLRVVVP
jgi:YegS/Rv2252/BmrU family lipid kinase